MRPTGGASVTSTSNLASPLTLSPAGASPGR
jgi:hypothetical protein